VPIESRLASVDDAALTSFDLIAADDIEQARIEPGDLTAAVEIGATGWDKIVQMGDIIAGLAPGRGSSHQQTLFKSLGIAIWDIALADRIFRAAVAAGIGTEVNMHWDVPG
jgi:ornithine cyclodeaminase/alanine dehydrogenase-like protein (mu-crystallin family)